MDRQKPYRTARIIFGSLFLISLIVFIVFGSASALSMQLHPYQVVTPTEGYESQTPYPTDTPILQASPTRAGTKAIPGDTSTPTEVPPTSTPTPKPLIPPEVMSVSGWLIASLTSCVTSLVTLVGFVSTTVLEWRKEHRERDTANLEMKRQEVELMKLKLEMKKMKDDTTDSQKKSE